jgi:O-antigen/teichoic acid export membrane protein
VWSQARSVTNHPVAWLVLFLPIMALTRHGTEVLTAYKAYLPSMLIYRGLLPLTALLLMSLARRHLGHHMTSSHAAVVLGTAWIVSLLALLPAVQQRVPSRVRAAKPSYQWKAWMAGSLGFLTNALILTTLSNGVLIVLEVFHSDESAVGVFGAVVQTASFVVLMATSTNRLFLPRLSEFVAQGQGEMVAEVLRDRVKAIAPLLAVSGLILFMFGEQILDLFRHHSHEITHTGRFGPYAERGYWTLLVMAAGNTVSTWLAPAPFHLMYLGRSRQTIRALGSATLVAMVSAVPMSRQWNELGAAIAYAVPITLAFLWMRQIVRRQLAVPVTSA